MEEKEKYIDKISGDKLIKTTYDGNSNELYYYNNIGEYHRVDGPAVEHKDENGVVDYQKWYYNGNLHNENGPAIERPDGTKKWYIEGKEYTELEFNLYVRNLKLEKL